MKVVNQKWSVVKKWKQSVVHTNSNSSNFPTSSLCFKIVKISTNYNSFVDTCFLTHCCTCILNLKKLSAAHWWCIIFSRENTYCSWLRHGKHINHSHCVVINKFPQHQSHDLHWYTSTPMLQHLMKSKYMREKSQKMLFKIQKWRWLLWNKMFSAFHVWLPWAGPERRYTPALLCPQQVHLLVGPKKSKQSLFQLFRPFKYISCSDKSQSLNWHI